MIIGTNFKLSSAKFLDDRQLCKDYATLIANTEGIIYPPGFEVFCEYENKYYQYVSDTNGGYIWEERKSGVSDGTIGASIKDDTISEDYTWSSAHIDSMRMDLENLITQANDYVDEIDERMLFIEGKFQWFEYFDGSYESLTDKPTIPTKISELEDDIEINTKIEGKVDKEEGKVLIDFQELNRLSTIENYDDTELRNRLLILDNNSHSHDNGYVLDSITEEMIEQWNNNIGGVEDYNYLVNKPIMRIGEDIDLIVNVNDIKEKGIYIINGIICGIQFINELCLTYSNDLESIINILMLNSMKKIVISGNEEEWEIIEEENYGVDKNNAKISDTLTIGEDKIILDKEGNGWYGGKVSQEGIPTEDKDLVTKGYVDERFTNYATNERINAIDKENARRDVIIEALANGRKRTIETDGNDVDLMFSTEKDNIWIDKIEGDTMVNVCDQEEPIAITKSYTVEGTNHVPLQGEYDGKCRPVVQGNTLVNHNIEYDKSIIIGEKIDNRQGTEILNFEGTPNCEIKVDIDGHTALNLSTKKEDILCKSFDSASGNEINLVAEENSVSDLVIQGNTMVNLVQRKGDSLYHYSGSQSTFNRDVVGNFCTYLPKSSATTHDGLFTIKTGAHTLMKANALYTIIFTIKENTLPDTWMGVTVRGTVDPYYIGANGYPDAFANVVHHDNTFRPTVGTHKIVITLPGDISSFTGFGFGFETINGIEGDFRFTIGELMIFEGDLTQTPELIPTGYVEGLQSTFEDKLIPYSIYNGDNLTSITETQYQLPLTIKSNTQYTVTTTANTTKYQYAVYSTDGLTEYLSYDTTVATQTFTCDTNNVYFKVRMNPSYEDDDYSFVLDEVKDKFLIVEGDWTDRLDLLTEEYFGKYRVDMESYGKNLFDGNLILNKTINFHTGDEVDFIGESCSDYIKVKPNTNYFINSFSYQTDNSSPINIYFYDENRNGINYSSDFDVNDMYSIIGLITYAHSATFTTPNNTKYIRFRIVTTDTSINVQLEEGTQATPYEPYYGSSKTVYLNSPLLNGDELLTKDGKLYHYHKMGMVVLDGSEDWKISSNYTVVNYMSMYVATNYNSLDVCDKFKIEDFSEKWVNTECQEEFICYNNTTNDICIRISQSKLSTTDVNGFKQWLSENPTTVVYELAEPWYEPIGAYGKIVLDGSENVWLATTHTNTIVFGVTHGNSPGYSNSTSIITDRFPTTNKCYTEDVEGTYSHATDFIFSINKSKLSTPDANGFKQWLQQNPITVIYELANPQYITEDMIFDIATTSTIEYQSSVPMANTQFLPYRNELPLLESSTQYRVTFDCDVEGLELMVSLGGTSQTITSALHNELSFITPALQTDGKLTIDGYGIAKIDNVLITKGDMEYKYFEGLKSGFEEGRKNKIIEVEKGFINDNGENTTNDWYQNDCVRNIDYIKIDNGKTYKFYSDLNYNFIIHEYYEDKTYLRRRNIGSDNATNINIYTPSSDCKYIRFRSYVDYHENNTNVKIIISDILDSTFEELYNQYKAIIRIKNPNAPIFGKGGRL